MTNTDAPVLIITNQDEIVEELLEEVEPAFEYHWQQFSFFRGFMEGQKVVLGDFDGEPEVAIKRLVEEYHPQMMILVGDESETDMIEAAEYAAAQDLEVEKTELPAEKVSQLLRK